MNSLAAKVQTRWNLAVGIEVVMNAHQSTLSWLLIVAGFLLLTMYGHLGLAMVLIPVAGVLGYGLLWVGRKVDHLGHGLK